MFILSHQQINGVGNVAQQANHSIPSARSKLFLFERVGHNKCGRTVAPIITIKSMALIPSTWIGVIDEVRPRIMRMLNTLLPKILPKASCGLFLQAANTDVMKLWQRGAYSHNSD